MKQNQPERLLFSFAFLCSSLLAGAQNSFSYQAVLDTVYSNGFYNISLSPELLSKSSNRGEDIRIKDAAGEEAPYILYTESARLNEESFTEFPIEYSKNRTSVFISNILPNSLTRLFLLINNSEVQRKATLSGSNDGEQWFIIKENFILQNEYAAANDAFVQSVSFPASSYKYFRITMLDTNVLPLNIVKAGVYRSSFTPDVYDPVPAPQIVQKDSSDKKTYVYLLFDERYTIDKLNLFLTGAKWYKRPVVVYDKSPISKPLSRDTVTSENPAAIEFHAQTNRLLLVIENNDNQPLKEDSILAFQLHTSATAYLEKGKQYTLYIGDSAALAPSYDLQYFDDSIGTDIQPLKIKSIEKINKEIPEDKSDPDTGKWLLWGIIIAVLLSLIYFSFRLMGDINKKEKQDVHL